MVAVPANTLALEERREAQARRNLVLGDEVVAVLGLVDDELADLLREALAGMSDTSSEQRKERIRGQNIYKRTCNSVSVIVCLETRA